MVGVFYANNWKKIAIKIMILLKLEFVDAADVVTKG
jgi:hypothetical protein